MAENEIKENKELVLFENSKIRRQFYNGEWNYSIVDIIEILTESKDPNTYWRVMKKRLSDEGNESVTNCNGLKMIANDGKLRKTDCANRETIFRLIQSIPSPNAEPFKLWFARLAEERIQEIIDPSLAIERARKTYLKKGKCAIKFRDLHIFQKHKHLKVNVYLLYLKILSFSSVL